MKLLPILPMLLVFLTQATLAASFTVTTTEDEFNTLSDPSPDTGLSLREAIRDANAASLTEDLTIHLPAGSYALTIQGAGEDGCATGDLDVTNTSGPYYISIQGDTARTTIIDATGLGDRVLDLAGNSTLELHDLTLTGGEAPAGEGGGGIRANSGGDLVITRCIIDNNLAPVGGGIFNDEALLSISGSTINNNSADIGGGIYSKAVPPSITTTISNSTISGNHAREEGGGIYNFNGLTEIISCTISANNSSAIPAGGGGIASYGDATTTTNLTNSIICANTPTDVELDVESANSFTSDGYNLVGTSEGAALSAFDQDGDTTMVTDPLLGPLAWYGGPTRTMHPLNGSPVLDTGYSAMSAMDQRGFNRSVNSACDTGAVEAGPALTVTNPADNGPGSLRQAIANATTPGHRILFDDASFPVTIGLTSSELVINDGRSVFLDASDIPGGVTIDAQSNGRVLSVRDADTTVALHSFTLTGGRPSSGEHGGAIYNRLATLTVGHSTLTGNAVSGVSLGGGLYNWDGTVLLTRSIVSGNEALPGSGGGLSNLGGGLLELTHSTVSENSANDGAGVHSYTNPAGRTVLTTSTIAENTATVVGGGIFNYLGHTDLHHCTISRNTAQDQYGSGVASSGDGNTQTTVRASIISGNQHSDVDCVPNTSISFLSNGYNLIGTGNATSAFSMASDLPDIINPLLAPLGDFCGPIPNSPIMPPLPGSPAIIREDEPSVAGPDQLGSDVFNDRGSVEAFPFSNLPLVDTDDDGIDDRLEGSGGGYPHLTVGVDDSTLDTDGDGRSDATEIADMTNLYDPNDYFRILSIKPHPSFEPLTNPLFTVTVKTFPGLDYEFETSSDLNSPFTTLPSSSFTATNYNSLTDLLLAPTRDFVRVKRK